MIRDLSNRTVDHAKDDRQYSMGEKVVCTTMFARSPGLFFSAEQGIFSAEIGGSQDYTAGHVTVAAGNRGSGIYMPFEYVHLLNAIGLTCHSRIWDVLKLTSDSLSSFAGTKESSMHSMKPSYSRVNLPDYRGSVLTTRIRAPRITRTC